jgi:hypothetical protein
MEFRTFFGELKRRNVYKIAVAYSRGVLWVSILVIAAAHLLGLFFLGQEPRPVREKLPVSTLCNHDTGTPVLFVDPLLRSLRNDPRYKNLLAKLGLPTAS